MTKSNKKVKLNVRVSKTKGREKTVEERVIDKEEFIEGFEDKVEHYVENYVDHVERTKRLTLISGVGFFMLLIVFFYAYNFKYQVQSLVKSDRESQGINSQVKSIKNDISNIVDDYKEIKGVIDTEIKEAGFESEQVVLEETEQEALSELEILEPEPDQLIEVLKEKLLEQNIGVPASGL